MTKIKKKLVIIFFEFFKDVDLEELEETIRRLQRQKRFPAFSMMIPMVHYKGLKVGSEYQDILQKEVPIVYMPNDFYSKHSRGKYENLVKREQRQEPS